MKETKDKIAQFKTTKTVRIIAFLGAVIFSLALSIEHLQHLGFYFLVTIYFWVYITFLYFERKYYKLTQNNFFNYLSKHPLSAISGLLPIVIFTLYKLKTI
ncbi:hypothetical protein [Lacinutrix undariae]